jgi:hypothetical protein
MTEVCCGLAGGFNFAAGQDCSPNFCVGDCCLPDGTCDILDPEACESQGGDFGALGTTSCAGIDCGGACCLLDGTCVADTSLEECTALGGSYKPFQDCDPNPCITRGGCSDKGSLLFWSKVELRWDSVSGVLRQDTFVTLNNDFGSPVRVKMFFVNGDTCAFLNVALLLTANEPIYWKASTGMPQTVPPFTALGPGEVVGNERVLRGYIVGWAVNNLNEEIRWNHLSGGATIVNYAQAWAWEYTSCAFKAVNVPHGAQTGDPGVINLDGQEFEVCGDFLLYDFWADGEAAFTQGGVTIVNIQDLTLHPASVDLRQGNDGPVITKADVHVWNENEFKVSGIRRCINCWDQAMLTEWGTGFALSNVQTDKARARIDGVAHNSELVPPFCFIDFNENDSLPVGTDPRDLLSIDAALLGLSTKFLTFGADTEPGAAAGTHLVWTGTQSATILYQTQQPSPESNTPPEDVPPVLQEVDDLIHRHLTGEDRNGE